MRANLFRVFTLYKDRPSSKKIFIETPVFTLDTDKPVQVVRVSDSVVVIPKHSIKLSREVDGVYVRFCGDTYLVERTNIKVEPLI